MDGSNSWRGPALAAAMIMTAAPAMGSPLDGHTTSGIVRTTAKTDRLSVSDITLLKTGLDALTSGDIDGARASRDRLPVSSLDRHILAWVIALKGGARVSSAEISVVAKTLPDWPGAEALRRNGQRALLREKPDAQAVIRSLGGSEPESAQGAIVLARAYVTLGEQKNALATLLPLWRVQKLEPNEQAAILREFGDLIPAADHRIRMERMLYTGRVDAAGPLAERSGAKPLFDAWVAVENKQKSAGKLLDAVPAAQRSPGYLFAKAKYLRRNEKFSEAATVVLEASKNPTRAHRSRCMVDRAAGLVARTA